METVSFFFACLVLCFYSATSQENPCQEDYPTIKAVTEEIIENGEAPECREKYKDDFPKVSPEDAQESFNEVMKSKSKEEQIEIMQCVLELTKETLQRAEISGECSEWFDGKMEQLQKLIESQE